MIVLVKINHPKYTHHPPLGLLYIADALRKSGFDVKIFHIPSNKVKNYIDKIIALKPLYVGFSVFTGEAMRSYAYICKEIKRRSSIPIVWGNAHPTLLPEQCLGEEYIDVVVKGEGEITAVELAKYFKNGEPGINNIKGIGYKNKEGTIIINPDRPFKENIDAYKPAWDLVDVEKYLSHFHESKRCLPISTSRGCPFDCGFCYNKKFNNCKWRAHSINYVTELVEELKLKYFVDGLIITDDNFFANRKRAIEFMQKLKMPYYCETKSAYFDEDFAQALYDTKCRVVLLGMESGSDRILKYINKRSTVADNINAVKAVSKFKNVYVSGSFIVAFPTETEEECKETMRHIVDLMEIKKEMHFTLGYYLPYPGSRLYDIAVEKGFVPPQKTEDWEDIDRWTSKTEIKWVDWMTSKKAVALREAVGLLAYAYNTHSMFRFFRNYIKNSVLTLDVDCFKMKLLFITNQMRMYPYTLKKYIHNLNRYLKIRDY